MSERKKNSSVMTVRVPKDLKARIEKAADKQGVSMNQFAIYGATCSRPTLSGGESPSHHQP